MGNIVAETINSKKNEIKIELEFNLLLVENEIEKLNIKLNDMISNKYFFKEHKEFLKDFMMNGYSRYYQEYLTFCQRYLSKIKNGKRAIISEIEIIRIQSYKSIKKKFKKHLIHRASKDLEKLDKCLIEINNDEKFFKIQSKITEMEKLKKDVELDISELKRQITPKVFPELEKRVNEYRILTGNNDLFFSGLFTEVLKSLDMVDEKIMQLYSIFPNEFKDLNYDISRLYILYFNLLDDYQERIIDLSKCETNLREITSKVQSINEKVEERKYGIK